MLRTQLACDLGDGYFFKNLLGGNKHFFVQIQSLLGPIFPSIFVTQPEQNCSVYSDRLNEDQRAV